MPDEPSPNLSVAHDEFSPCLSERSRDILHSLTRKRQTHDTDNNTRSSNDALKCHSFIEQSRSHVGSGKGGELPGRCNMTHGCNPHREQHENVAHRTEHTHDRGGTCILAHLTGHPNPVP